MTAIELHYLLWLSLRASFLNEILEVSAFGKSDTYITEKIVSVSETDVCGFFKFCRQILNQTTSLYCSDTERCWVEDKYICVFIHSVINLNNYQISLSEFACEPRSHAEQAHSGV